MNMDYKQRGYSTIQSYAFTLEANIGFVRAVTDMMLKTSADVITIFPAISEQLMKKKLYFKKLRAHGKRSPNGIIGATNQRLKLG